jgi:hypothetical protein
MLSNKLKRTRFFVMAGQKREARLRAGCPGMTSFALGTDCIGCFLSQTLRPNDILHKEPFRVEHVG